MHIHVMIHLFMELIILVHLIHKIIVNLNIKVNLLIHLFKVINLHIYFLMYYLRIKIFYKLILIYLLNHQDHYHEI